MDFGKLEFTQNNLSWLTIGDDSGSSLALFLHGFMGSKEDWLPFAENLKQQQTFSLLVDLPGHGDSPIDETITITQLSGQLASQLTQYQNKKIMLVGYSMGGRVAIDLLTSYPELFHSVVLESASPGIEDISERQMRLKSDQQLLSTITNQSELDHFLDHWYQNPIFGQLSKQDQLIHSLKQQRHISQVAGWQQSIAQLGVGNTSSYWEELHSTTVPITYITGELDKKYSTFGKKLKSSNPLINHQLIMECGHNAHLEKPEQFGEILNSSCSRSPVPDPVPDPDPVPVCSAPIQK